MSEMDDAIIEEFLADSHEGLDRLDRDLLALEREPGAKPALDDAFRALHTIKGTCSFLGYRALERVAHAGENLLARVRAGALEPSADVTAALLATVDAVRVILGHVERSRSEGPDSFDDVVLRAEALAGRAAERAARSSATADTTSEAVRALRGKREDAAAAASAAEANHLRVDVGLLDRLMNLASELVLVRNQVAQYSAARNWAELPGANQRLHHLTTRLQEEVMRTRMQPISTLWQRLPRLVHDVAAACGKRVRLDREGTSTELDKALIEALKDPLVHLVRNAVDHGIESPEARAAAGKPAEGVVRIAARHEGGQVLLTVADDGGGIRVDRIREAALERGLLAREDAERASERQWLQFLFLPGFTTAKEVTAISGRGVGLDVVKSGIERIGGSIEVDSDPGRGTTFRLRIPLTLAIVPVLLVEEAGARFAIPQVSVDELVPLHVFGGDAFEQVEGAPVMRLRGTLLPLVFLAESLGLATRAESLERRRGQIAVVTADGRRLGLVFERIVDTQEIVVKPLAQSLRALRAYAGATLLGDGGIALILDLPGLARRAGFDAAAPRAAAPPPPAPPDDRARGLLVSLGGERLAIVPLEHVARIESFAPGSLARGRDGWAAEWQGRLLPVVPLGTALGDAGDPAWSAAAGTVPVLVCECRGKTVGFAFERVEDVLALDPDGAARAIVGGRLAEVVDLAALAEAA